MVNAGSVGMPFGRTGADWLVIDTEVHLRHTDYDLEHVANRIRRRRIHKRRNSRIDTC